MVYRYWNTFRGFLMLNLGINLPFLWDITTNPPTTDLTGCPTVIEWDPFWGNQTMQVNGDLKGFSLEKVHLGGGFKYFYFHPYLGKIPILTTIIQRG